ncbi:MAG: hypothetical protein LBE35_05705 [Clostridiales bacterium]|jgi:hypothetical protein|nr:hypothetical protein [Clostridiales bacterium]
MNKATIKNIIICILVIACGALAVRLWFGALSMPALFGGTAGATTLNPRDEAAAAPIISSARLILSEGGDFRVYYNNLDNRAGWRLAYAATRQLIEAGVFMRSGGIDEAALSQNTLTIEYNFPMPASFFREFFGTRPGFLSSHFSEFYSLTISRGESHSLEFTFKTHDNFYTFSLNSPALFVGFNELFAEAAPEAEQAHEIIPVPISNLFLAGIPYYIDFLFPGAISNSTINEVWTYWDSRRVARFFPDNVLEFNARPHSSSTDNFIDAALAAFAVLNLDKQNQIRQGAPMNEVILTHYGFNSATGRHHFYFDYILNDAPINLQEILPEHQGHALEIQIIGSEVVSYRRLMLNFVLGEIQ